MAFQNAKGNGPNTGMPKSVAPTKRVAANLDFGGKGDQGYGRNRYGGPSSLTPGQTTESALATDLRTTAAAGGDDVLSTVQKLGAAAMRSPLPGDEVEDVAGLPGSQVRDVGDKNVPDSFGMSSARSRQATYPGPKETIPGAIPGGLNQGGNNSAFGAELAAKQHGKK
jgi:hypothetical protein